MNRREILQGIPGDSLLSLPILTESAQWMTLLPGKSANLVGIDLPEIVIGTDTTSRPGETLDTEQRFNLPQLPGTNAFASGRTQARINLDFGFDARGLLGSSLNVIDGFPIIDCPDATEVLLRQMRLTTTLPPNRLAP